MGLNKVKGTEDIEMFMVDFNIEDYDASSKESYADRVEEYVARCNNSANRGIDLVNEGVYATLVDYLSELRPNSPILHSVWKVDDNSLDFSEELDAMLQLNPILSVYTVKNIVNDLFVKQFKGKLYNFPTDVICSMKLKGYAIRVVYKDGILMKATAKGRSTGSKDLTRQAIAILGRKKKELRGRGVVEFRGEVVLPLKNLEKARKYNPKIKSTFSGVATLLKDSASDKEVKLLNIVFSDVLGELLMFDTLSGKYGYMERLGFETPLAYKDTVERYSLEDDLARLVGKMEIMGEDYPYDTEGVMITIDDDEMFDNFGSGDKYRLGQMTLKVGSWKENSYSGVVKEIKWLDGKSKKIPVAILKEGVIVDRGHTITEIPLYAPCYIMMLEAYPDKVIHFRYGGDAGVVPTTSDGKIIVNKTVED